ncbi:MAG: peptide transporter [Planctomycetota bacterium]|jgi:hypothetical protein
MGYSNDKELATYRNLIEKPSTFEEGFGLNTIIGALFLGFLITPGSLYIYLVAGEGIGPAARWVTIFLFAEIAKRSLKEMRQQEVFVLYYMTGHLLLSPAIINSSLLFKTYLVQSEAFKAMGMDVLIPEWVVPQPENWEGRTMFTSSWILPIGLYALTTVIARLDHFGLGYFMYRVTSDGERLPFPMASVGASGIVAMAETKDKNLQWRPACFSIGGIMGLGFGVIYLLIPAVTGVLLREPIYIIPIPWIELTPAMQDLLPATAVNLVPNLAIFILGMVLPFWAVVGGFMGVVITFILNPILYNGGILRGWFGVDYEGGVLHTWKPDMETVDTLFSNHIDFYLSFGLGITLFIAFIGIAQAMMPLLKLRKNARAEVAKLEGVAEGLEDDGLTTWQRARKGVAGRGDISMFISVGIYIFSTTSYLLIASQLCDGNFPWLFFGFYAFLYTPLISYATAKIEGLAGQNVGIPYVREAGIILSGYKGLDIWFVPIPVHNYGLATKEFRVIELTGTRLSSIIKTDILTLPLIIACTVIFSSVIWGNAELGSDVYPYVQKVWDLQSRNQAVILSSTLEGERSLFFEAMSGTRVAIGFGVAAVLYAVLSAFGLPVLLIFGVVRGLAQTNPMGLIPELIGALIGRFYFKKKFGDMWLKYTPAIFAGFTYGVGLVGMISVALRLISASIAPLPY